MAQQFGFWTELATIESVTLSDDGETAVTTFMAMPYGEYEHPQYGKLKLSYEKAVNMAKNVAAKVRGTDLDIDYDHKAKDGKAAGWVQGAEARSNGLYLTVAWTKAAWEAIKNKEYRYFSPEYHDEWKHPQTQVVHKDVLFGGGITNRPFLKDILPINMSELLTEHTQEETTMDPKKRRQLLGLPEDATDAQCEAAEDTRLKEIEAAAEADQAEKDKAEKEKEKEAQQVAASEIVTAALKKLSESTNPELVALAEAVKGMQTQLDVTATALQLSETANQVNKLSEPVEGRSLPAGTVNAIKDILSTPGLPKALSDKIVDAFAGLNKAGYVLSEETATRTRPNDGGGSDDAKKFNDAVDAKILADKTDTLTYADAVTLVASERPDLFEAHRQASYAFKTTD